MPKSRSSSLHDFRQVLVDSGLRVTEQRVLLLQELARTRAPASHRELAGRLKSLDRTTVYRNLLSMTATGLLLKTRLTDNIWRFALLNETSTSHAAHPHFVCTDCGIVACLPPSSVHLSGDAACVEVAEVQLRGRCRDCAPAVCTA